MGLRLSIKIVFSSSVEYSKSQPEAQNLRRTSKWFESLPFANSWRLADFDLLINSFCDYGSIAFAVLPFDALNNAVTRRLPSERFISTSPSD